MSHEMLPWKWKQGHCVQVHPNLIRMSLLFIRFLQKPQEKDYKITQRGGWVRGQMQKQNNFLCHFPRIAFPELLSNPLAFPDLFTLLAFYKSSSIYQFSISLFCQTAMSIIRDQYLSISGNFILVPNSILSCHF